MWITSSIRSKMASSAAASQHEGCCDYCNTQQTLKHGQSLNILDIFVPPGLATWKYSKVGGSEEKKL
jgi:hypothetical protein